MSNIYSAPTVSFYGTGSSWALHQGMEILGDYARWGKIPFPTLANGRRIANLTWSFYKTNSGGGGTFNMYAAANPLIVPNQVTSLATFVGTTPTFGSGTGKKVLVFDANMAEILSWYPGDFEIYFTCSVYVTFTGYGTNAPYFSGVAYDGSMWDNIGGVWRASKLKDNVSGVWRNSRLWDNVNGIWRKDIALL